MKLSTKGQYGVKAMFDLAMRYGEDCIPLKQVAESQFIPENYLEQLASQLRKAGLLESVRGPQGGYRLARSPQEITIGEIIRILEGPITLVDCAPEEGQPSCVRAKACVTRNIWAKMAASIAAVVDSITLADLCQDARSKDSSPMLHI